MRERGVRERGVRVRVRMRDDRVRVRDDRERLCEGERCESKREMT